MPLILDFPARRNLDELDRQLRSSLLIGDIAERLYFARTVHLGGSFLAWSELTPQQREGFRSEVEQLITQSKGDK